METLNMYKALLTLDNEELFRKRSIVCYILIEFLVSQRHGFLVA